MTEVTPQQPQEPAIQQHDDARDLNLLSIFYYILSALQALFGCCPILYFIMGVIMVITGLDGQKSDVITGGIVIMVVTLIITAVLWTIAFALFLTGRKLKNHESPTFCFVMAIVTCLNFPMGTILGVFTIIVLNRPSVKALFEARKNQPYTEEYLRQWK